MFCTKHEHLCEVLATFSKIGPVTFGSGIAALGSSPRSSSRFLMSTDCEAVAASAECSALSLVTNLIILWLENMGILTLEIIIYFCRYCKGLTRY